MEVITHKAKPLLIKSTGCFYGVIQINRIYTKKKDKKGFKNIKIKESHAGETFKG